MELRASPWLQIPFQAWSSDLRICFSGTALQNTFTILIICNTIHYFSTPYLMVKNSLLKMNASWETTAMLMGDNWIKTILRVVTPNACSTLLELFRYYFVNAMVTISAVIFIAGTRTMLLRRKLKNYSPITQSPFIKEKIRRRRTCQLIQRYLANHLRQRF